MKRKRGVTVIMFVFLAIVALAFSESEVKVSPEVTIGEFIGNTTVYLKPTKFPKFSNGSSDNKKCREYLESMDPLLDRAYYINNDGILPDYGSNSSPNCRYLNEFNDATGRYYCKENNTTIIKNGKTMKDCGIIDCGEGYVSLELNSNLENSIEIPAGYRNIAKVLFTWTVRVVGNRPNECSRIRKKELNGLAIWPLLCYRWHSGKITQDFSGGKVSTQLYIKGSGSIKAEFADGDGWAPLNPVAEMTVPAGPPGVVNEPGDPTITGSYIVTKDDFLNSDTGKDTLPPIIYFKLMWHNDSPLVVESLANQRNVVAMLMPITDIIDEENE